jgi:hypothetical protein
MLIAGPAGLGPMPAGPEINDSVFSHQFQKAIHDVGFPTLLFQRAAHDFESRIVKRGIVGDVTDSATVGSHQNGICKGGFPAQALISS